MAAAPKIVDTKKFRANVFKAFVVGMIGCVAVEMIGVRVDLDLHFLDIFIALIVLGVVQHDAGEETVRIRLLSLGLMLVSLVAANLVLIAYLVRMPLTMQGGDPSVSFVNALVPVLGSLGIMHWVWVIITLAAAFDLFKVNKPNVPAKPPAEKI